MTDFEKEIIAKNESWIKLSKLQIAKDKESIAREEKCIRDLAAQNRVLKGKK